MAISKEEIMVPDGKLEIPILGFVDNKKIGGFLNEIFSSFYMDVYDQL